MEARVNGGFFGSLATAWWTACHYHVFGIRALAVAPGPLFVVSACGTAVVAVSADYAFDEAFVPGAVLVFEIETLLGVLLAEPEGFALRDVDRVEPGVSWGVVGELEDNVDFFEGAECRLGVEEVDKGNNCEVCRGEDDPGSVGDPLECDRCDEDDAVGTLANAVEEHVQLKTLTQS